MKTKRIISLLASLAMMVTAVTGAMSVSAETDSGDCGEVKWSFDSSTGKLTISGEGAMASPDDVVGVNLDITDEGLGDFSNTYSYKKYKKDIKEVVIEEGVTTIGFCAFYNMQNLETVVLPSTITDFSGYRYPGVSVNYRNNYAFAKCTKLKNLTLSEGMTAIGGYSFYGCTSLKSVRIPSTITESRWGYFSFKKCSSLKDITLPEGLTIIGPNVFSETAVEKIIIPSSIVDWDYQEVPNQSSTHNSAFQNCEKLSSVTFKEGLKTIRGYVFENCSSLKKVVIPSSVIDLYAAFGECTGLEEAYIEEGAQIVGQANVDSKTVGFQNAFNNCTNLKKLEIPSGVEIDYNNARWCTGCSSLTDLYIHGKDYSYFPVSNNMSRVHCYSGTETYNSLMKNGIGGPRLVDIEEEIENTREELNKAVTEAEKYAEEDYTPESYGVLKALLEKAGKYGEDPSVMSMKDTTEGIYAAIDGLVDKSNEPSSSEPSSSDPSDSSNPTDNSSDPSNSSGNNNQSQSPNTPATPTTAAPTTATPKPTTPPTVTTTAAKPAKVKAVKVKAKKKKLNVSWKKVSGATGYEVQYATNNKFTKNKKTVTVKKNKVTLKNLKPKKKYFVKVRAYKLANGRKYFGKWSKVVKKKTK